MTLPEDHDPELEALLKRAKARNAEAETELHDRFRRFVWRRLDETRIRRNWFWLTDLESAVQEVFTQFFKALWAGQFAYEGRRRFEGFLVRTGFFVAMNLKDKAKNNRAISIHDDEEGGLRFDMAAFGEAVYDGLGRRDCLKLLTEAIQSLNENRQDIIERTLLGQKVRHICAETGRTPASVSGLKFNAMVELRKKLAGAGFVGKCGELFNLTALNDDAG